MKIEYTRNSRQKFGDVEIGTVFECDSRIYMKTAGIFCESNPTTINAVALVMGNYRYFEDFTIVTVINCKLVIED